MKDFSKEDIERMSRSLLLPPQVPVRRLTIGKPWVDIQEGHAIQRCMVSIGEVEREIFFKVDAEFAGYLCHERGDAYLVGLLSLAMRERCDIYSDVPLTRELVHQIETELVPTLVKYVPALYTPAIHAELADALPSAGKVGTGCSCGIDSLYAIKALTDREHSAYGLDYVTLNNVGAYSWRAVTSTGKQQANARNARECCETYGYKLILTDSNFADAFPQEHYKTHHFSSCFAIHMLGKLWGRYYYGSTGCDLDDYFGLTENDLYDSARYDLLALPAFSTSQLRICNQGLAVDRFEKTKELLDFEPAQKFLNVCASQGKGNCGCCPKCLRTLWMLDALGRLDDFSEAFDIAAYRKNRSRNLFFLYRNYLNGGDHHMNDAAWHILKRDVGLPTILEGWMWRLGHLAKERICPRRD